MANNDPNSSTNLLNLWQFLSPFGTGPQRPANIAPFDWSQFTQGQGPGFNTGDFAPGAPNGGPLTSNFGANQISPMRPSDVPQFDWGQFGQSQQDFPGTTFTPGTYTPGTPPHYADPTAQANKVYDPQIAAIQALMTSTQHRGDVNSANIKDMYAALAGTAAKDSAATTKQFNASQAATKGAYQQAGNSVDAQYNSSQAAQLAMMKKLGIDAAAPQALAQQSADQNFVKGLLQSSGASANSALEQNKQSSAALLNNLNVAAPLAGNQKQIDLMAQVQDRIDQLNANKMTLAGDKASKIADFQSQAANALAQFNQQEAVNKNNFNQSQAAGQQQALDNQFKWSQEMRNQADQTLQKNTYDQQTALNQQKYDAAQTKINTPGATAAASTWNKLLASAQASQVANPQDYVGYLQNLVTTNNDIRHGSAGGFNMTPEQFAAIAVQNAPGGMQQSVLVDLAQQYWSSQHGK